MPAKVDVVVLALYLVAIRDNEYLMSRGNRESSQPKVWLTRSHLQSVERLGKPDHLGYEVCTVVLQRQLAQSKSLI